MRMLHRCTCMHVVTPTTLLLLLLLLIRHPKSCVKKGAAARLEEVVIRLHVRASLAP